MDMNFDPFEDRKSRDIRNALAHGIIEGILSKDMEPFESKEASLLKETQSVPDYIHNYIIDRKNRLQEILIQLNSFESSLDNHSIVCILLWNQNLFFEFHEWIEEKWLAETGDKRKALQALILLAVVYEHLEYNRPLQAKKVAKKVIGLFEKQKNNIPKWINQPVFIKKLENLDHAPPLINMGNL